MRGYHNSRRIACRRIQPYNSSCDCNHGVTSPKTLPSDTARKCMPCSMAVLPTQGLRSSWLIAQIVRRTSLRKSTSRCQAVADKPCREAKRADAAICTRCTDYRYERISSLFVPRLPRSPVQSSSVEKTMSRMSRIVSVEDRDHKE